MQFSSFLGKIRFMRKTTCNGSRHSKHKDRKLKASNGDISIKEGYTWKRSFAAPLRKWKKRYFVLSWENLYIFKDKSDASHKIVRILDIVSLMIEDFGLQRKEFCLRLRETNRESYLLKFCTENERNDWMTAVLTAKSVFLER